MALSPSNRPEQATLNERFACFRAQALPPPIVPLSAAEIAQGLRAAEAAQRRGRWARALRRRLPAWVRRWADPSLGWREKLRATPVLGGGLRWGAALLRLGRWRLELVERVGRLEGELARERALREAAVQGLQQDLALVRALSSRDTELPAPVYLALEEGLRGDSAAIAQRQQVYLPYARAAATLGLPCVDLGCGRGEWLGLLRAAGIQAVGVEANAAMAGAAQQRGLAVTVEDAGSWLQRQRPASFALASLFQVVEHLPPGLLWVWLEQLYRVLAPGGWLIIETPNPENLQVAAYSFWLDPTHRRPLPPPLLNTLVHAAGFTTQEILRFAPWPELGTDSAGYPPYLRKLLFCEQDYALIARKPGGT